MWLDLDLRGARDPRGRPIGVSAGLPIRDPAMKRSMTAITKNCDGTVMTEFGLLQEAGALAFTDGDRAVMTSCSLISLPLLKVECIKSLQIVSNTSLCP